MGCWPARLGFVVHRTGSPEGVHGRGRGGVFEEFGGGLHAAPKPLREGFRIAAGPAAEGAQGLIEQKQRVPHVVGLFRHLRVASAVTATECDLKRVAGVERDQHPHLELRFPPDIAIGVTRGGRTSEQGPRRLRSAVPVHQIGGGAEEAAHRLSLSFDIASVGDLALFEVHVEQLIGGVDISGAGKVGAGGRTHSLDSLAKGRCKR